MAAFVGVDIGTGSTRAIAYNEQGEVLAERSVGYPIRFPRRDRAEQDPEEIFDATLDCLGGVVQTVRKTGDEVSGISFSAAMHSLLAVDERGDPLTPSTIYADNRATEQAKRILEDMEGADIHCRTGTPVHPMSPLAKLLWFREEDRATFEAAVRWISVKEYVFHRLFGEYVVDYSIASASGLFNLKTLSWEQKALNVAGISEEKLSRPVPTTHVVDGLDREYAERLGLDRMTPFVVGANDGVLANLGVGAIDPGVVACSIGTSGAVRSVVPEPQVDDGLRLFCYPLTEDKWVIGGPINNGGIALQWVVEELFPDLKGDNEEQGGEPHELASQLVEDISPGSEGLIFLPYLTGERAPHWNADVRGVFFGLHLQHGRKHLLRAVIEGVTYQMYAVQQALEKVIGEPAEIRATGGFANSAIWRQIMADVFRQEIVFPESYESSCWGAALLGMKALGMVSSIDVAYEMSRISERHRPDTDAAEIYGALVPIFGRLYERLEPEFAEVSRLQSSMRRNDETAGR